MTEEVEALPDYLPLVRSLRTRRDKLRATIDTLELKAGAPAIEFIDFEHRDVLIMPDVKWLNNYKRALMPPAATDSPRPSTQAPLLRSDCWSY
jgi:hypothetical protein